MPPGGGYDGGMDASTPSAVSPRSQLATSIVPWLLIGAIGWGFLLVLGASMLSTRPATAGFDLELLLDAGRRVAAGQSPYDPSLVGGGAVDAPSLFYSYPPPVAQGMRLVAALPSWFVLVAWGIGASAAFAAVAVAIARRIGRRDSGGALAVPVLAIAPFVFPYAIGLLFGNLNVWFPALYGLILLAGVAPAGSAGAIGGVALGVVSVAKLHPASLGVWFLVRGPAERRVAAIAGLTIGAIVVASLLVGGFAPWAEYVSVVRAGAAADVVDSRNAGPAATIALLSGMTGSSVGLLQALVTVGSVGLTAWAARSRRDPVESLAWAAAASLVTLPVTWFHYPSALLPFAVAAIARAPLVGAEAVRRTTLLAAAAILVGIIAIAATPLIWVAIALVIAAVHESARSRPGTPPKVALRRA